MMRKTKVWAWLTMLCMFFVMAVAVACTNGNKDDSSSSAVAEITLDKTTLELDLHESMQLTATKKNTEAEIVWTSSAPSVATVENGLVKSIKKGTATVTASAGGASAECAVTVIDSQTAPVLKIEYDKIAVDKDGELTVHAQILYKGNPVTENITYAWAFSEGAAENIVSLTPAADTASALVKGLAYGETSFEVSALVWGVPLMQKVDVKVCNTDITFEVTGVEPDEGGYLAEVALLEVGDHVTSVAPAVTVKEKGVEKADAKLDWNSENAEIASVSEQGVIAAVGEGETIVRGTYQNNVVKISVKVYRPETHAAKRVEIETSGDGSFIADSEIVGRINKVLLAGENICNGFDVDTRKVTLDKSKLPSAAANMGETEMTIETEKAIYNVDAAVYTKVIRTAEDLDEMGALSKAAESAANLWGGYFVLGNDIEYNKEFVSFINYGVLEGNSGKIWEGEIWNDGRANGFKGVFDGRGYVIKGFHLAARAGGGLFGIIHTDGVVKNVAFSNAVHDGWSGFIASGGNGRIENVYISCDVQSGGNNVDKSGFFYSQDCMGAARVVNCFVEIKKIAENAESTSWAIGSAHEGYGILQNVYAVGNTKAVNVISTGDGERNVYGAYADYRELVAAGVDFSAWEGDFWQVVNGLPYPKGLDLPEVIIEAPESGNIGYNTEILFELTPYVLVQLDDAAKSVGITMEGNKLCIPDDESIAGTRFTVTFVSVFDDTDLKTTTYTIVSSKTINVEGMLDVEMTNDSETFLVDLSQYADSLEGTIKSVKLGTESFVFSGTPAAVTLSKATFGRALGEQSVVMTLELEKDGVVAKLTTINFKVCVVTKIINTAEDLDGMGALSKAAESAANLWGGYFVLGKDIEYNKEFTSFISWETLNEVAVGGWTNGRDNGFKGTFDGRGHIIKGFKTVGAAGGMFGVIHQAGVVKNVSFVDATHVGWGGFISTGGDGLIENVYISCNSQGGGGDNDKSGFFYANDCMAEARVINCFVDIKAMEQGAVEAWGIGSAHEGYGILKNVYSVGNPNGVRVLSTGDGTLNVAAGYASRADMKTAGIAITAENGWDMTFWTTDADGLPLPRALAA